MGIQVDVRVIFCQAQEVRVLLIAPSAILPLTYLSP